MPNPAENAIPKDASEQLENQISGADDNSDGAENSVLSPRMAAMEAIAASRRETLTNEINDGGGNFKFAEESANNNAEQKTDNEPAPVETPPQDDQLAAQLAEDDRPSVLADDKALVRVKVDGVEMDLPISEVVKSYQKDSTATKRLQEATQLLRLAEQKASEVAQTTQQANNHTQATDGNEVVSEEDRLNQVKSAFSKLYEGDEEGAAKAMLELIGKGVVQQTATQAPIDESVVAAKVLQQLEVKSAYGQVKQDYPEIFANDERGIVLGKAAFERKVAKEAAGVPPTIAVREAVEEVANLFGLQKQGRQQAEPTRTARDTKLERKQNLDVPNSANVVAGTEQGVAEAPNVSSTIAEMAKARLGQSMNAGRR